MEKQDDRTAVHSEEPWRLTELDVVRDCVYSEDGTLIGIAFILADDDGGRRRFANARMFAAAPGLLEALRRIESLELRAGEHYAIALKRWAEEAGDIARVAIQMAEEGS